MLDIARLRGETPGCAEVVHFNNAGASLQPRPVLDTIRAHLDAEALMGGYEAADAAMDRLTGVYDSVARLIGAGPDEIAITENSTRAWDTAFYGMRFRPGERVLTSSSEYGSNAIAFLHAARDRGIKVEVLPDDEHGQVSLDALAATLDDDVRLVAVNHVPTHDGLVNPVAEIGRLTRASGALFLVDACQSVGQLAVDVNEIGCDFLSATGRKFLRGPRGMGFLYVRRAALEAIAPTFLDDRGAEWTGPDSYTMRDDAHAAREPRTVGGAPARARGRGGLRPRARAEGDRTPGDRARGDAARRPHGAARRDGPRPRRAPVGHRDLHPAGPRAAWTSSPHSPGRGSTYGCPRRATGTTAAPRRRPASARRSTTTTPKRRSPGSSRPSDRHPGAHSRP